MLEMVHSECWHQPERGTVRSEHTGGEASLFDYSAYPLVATCKRCGRVVRALHFYARSWELVTVRLL